MKQALETDYNYCSVPLAIYACRPDQTKGRLYDQPDSKTRTVFQRDRDRIIHSDAFRRLKYKTQVFIYHEGDHYRTRLTHSLEVAQVARSIARALMVNEDLTETVALAHDLGHPPFAHTGEEALEKLMEPYQGFEHNDQSLRIIVKLEERYPEFNGLNLSWESLEGVVKHNGPVTGELPYTLKRFNKEFDLEIDTHASIEAQIAALSDDIAYNSHDLEDGVRAGLLTFDQCREIPLINDALNLCAKKYPDLDKGRTLSFVVRHMMGVFVDDLIANSSQLIAKSNPQSPEEARKCGQQLIDFSPEVTKKLNQLRKFLFANMYHNYHVRRMRMKSSKIVIELFEAFMHDYKALPTDWRAKVEVLNGNSDDNIKARIVGDYIAGMTDRYAIIEHKRLFNLYEEHL